MMIISRTPLRISIGGGGTDLPSYYSAAGGHVISAAIDKYIYNAINDTFTNDYFLKYSQLERVDRREQIQHPLIRAMVEVAGEPFIRHQLRLLADSGIDDVVICVGYRGLPLEDEVRR
jgi:galactokinase/mevalonate kinase-like predicted kinase